MVENQQPKAIPLIAFNQKDSKFEINQEAFEMVSKLKDPIGVCSVAGMYRTGKSYLLNRMLLDRSDGFGVGPTINACTKGLWIWNQVVPGTSPDGEPISVLVIDTEGLGAFDETQNHDVRIFTLAILLSSYFLYNSMGSIDETSLNQLSLVVNLTKHIQLTASGCRSPGDIDPEEYQKIFPSFMWVVRDFALKLTDEHDTQITSKEYLERALFEQKGFSDSIEQKNKIRRLLKTFFTERDCCTVIRPVSNEAELQNLAQKDVSELRPEFQEQVKLLRKKVLGKIKPKSLNGKLLSGQMIMSLAQQYVDSINKGAVPNIESAWTYICQNECQKATEEAIYQLKAKIEQNLKLPCDDQVFKEIFKTFKQEALVLFEQKCFGQEIETYRTNLNLKIQEIKQSKLQQNVWETQKTITQFMQEQFQSIEVSLRQGQIQSFEDFKICMQEFLEYVETQSPPGSGQIKSDVVKEFISNSVLQTADQFNQIFVQTNKVQLAVQEERIKLSEIRNQEIKTEHNSILESMRQNQRNLEQERADLLAKETQNRLFIQNLEQETQKLKVETEQQMNYIKSDYEQKLLNKDEMLQQKIVIAQETQRQLFQVQSEGEKQTALLEQKIEFLTQKQQELQQKLILAAQEKEIAEKQGLESLKEVKRSFESIKLEFNQKLEEQQEKLFECQTQLNQAEERAQVEKTKITNLNQVLESNYAAALQKIELLTQQLESLGENNSEKVTELQAKLTQEISVREQMETANKSTILELQENYNYKIKDLEKEQAILEQKLAFSREENQTLQKQYAERHQAHESILKALEEKSNEYAAAKEIAQEQLQSVTFEHTHTVQELSRSFEQQIQQLQRQINELTDTNYSLESKLRVELQENSKQLLKLQEQITQTEKAKLDAENALINLQKTQSEEILKISDNFTVKIQNLEGEIEELTNQQQQNISEVQQKAEQQLSSLKQMYDVERQKLEQRLCEEKETSRKKYQQTIEEYEIRIRDEQQQREEDIEMLQGDIKENEMRYQNNIKQLEYDNQLLHQTLQQNSEQAREQEERLQKELMISNQQVTILNDRINQERQELQQKFQDLLREDALKEQQIASLLVNVQSLKDQIENSHNSNKESYGKIQAEYEKAQQKIEDFKTKVQQLQDELLRQQLDSSREIALFKQKIDFQDRKIEDLNKQLDSTINSYEERLKNLKQDSQQEHQEVQQRANAQYEALEAKFEVKRKKLKEQEAILQKKCTEIQKEKEIIDQQLQNAINNSKQQNQKLENEVLSLNEQINRLQDQITSERELYQSEMDRAKHQLNDIERDYCELQNNSERDKALLEGKCQFLEQQRDQAKSDYLEASRKFETTLDQLQKRGSQEKDRTETSQSAMLTSLELKFKKQLQEQIDEKQKLQFEHEENLNNIQKQVRELKLELQLSDRDRQAIKRQMEAKEQDWYIKEQELRQLISSAQNEKDSKSSNYLRSLEREREHFKQKFNEMEAKLKDYERSKTLNVFEVEKEKAKWTTERELLQGKTQELNETIEGLERQKENLLMENEKLRSQVKKNLSQQKQSVISGMRSPGRYGAQPQGASITHNFEPTQQLSGPVSKSIFVSTLSKALLKNNDSDTSSQHSLDLPNLSSQNQFKSVTTFENKALMMNGNPVQQKQSRVNVINFDLTRTKAKLSNITNTVKKQQDDSENM